MNQVNNSSLSTHSSMSNGINSNNGVETLDNIPDSEGGKYHVSEIIKVIIPPNKKYDL